jgi:hypothetical protein
LYEKNRNILQNKSINLQKDFLKKIEYKEKKNKQRDRSRKCKDEYSYREVLQISWF